MKNNKFKGFLKKAFSGRMAIVSSIVALLLVGATLAYLFSVGKSIVNTFNPGKVDVVVNEEIDGNTKKSITLTNTGNTNAFLRMAITSHYTGTYTLTSGGTPVTEIIGSMPAPISFNLNTAAGWVKYGNYYYYTKPVAPNKDTADLINTTGITLDYFVEPSRRQNTEVDVTYQQVVEVFAEAIQSAPVEAVQDAWGAGFSIDSNGNLVVPTT
jgi:hypothetical protein